MMDIHQLDMIFPFIVFGYGAVMTFVLNQPTLMRVAEERLPPETHLRFKANRTLGLICLLVGGLWSLQNLWLI